MDLTKFLIICSLLVAFCVLGAQAYEACPSGCRCTAPPNMMKRHRWQRLLAAYRTRRLIFGSYQTNTLNTGTEDDPEGREMTCLGLNSLEQKVPEDVSKVTFYGDNKEASIELEQDSPVDGFYFSQSKHLKNSKSKNQITSIGKLGFQPTSSVKELVIEGNNIKDIETNDFQKLTGLKKLKLNNNKIKSISSRALTGLQNLEVIDLSNNQIKKMTKPSFYDTPKVKKIDLSKNKLTELSPDIVEGLRYLEVFDVSDNFLPDLDERMFTTTENLREIHLDHNQIQIIRPDWFTNLRKLTHLSFKGNQVRDIYVRLLQPLPNLEFLSFEDNVVTRVAAGAFQGLDRLRVLKLGKNRIDIIQRGAFSNLNQLTELSLHGNRIDKVDDGIFTGLENLQSLSLASNELLDINAETLELLPNIQKLDLSHNFIKIIHQRNFYGCTQLREINLKNNKIRLIEDEGFAVSMLNTYSKITWLYLHNNELNNIGPRTFTGLSYLKFLNLGNNNIETIAENGLSMMGRLSTLFLNNNKIGKIQSGTFKHQKYVRYLNLAENNIQRLPSDIFNGLEQCEDLNMQGNGIQMAIGDIFNTIPNLVSLNMKENKLNNFDFTFMDAADRLRYLDLSKNSLSFIPTLPKERHGLYFLSLADNYLANIPQDILKMMHEGGSLHLYGNPWVCDCSLAWLLEVNSPDKQGSVKLEEPNDIACKSPRSLSGEQVLALKPKDFKCSSYEPYRYSQDQDFQNDWHGDTDLECTFMEHAEKENTKRMIKSKRKDTEDWITTMFDEELKRFCSGVAVAENWFLTPSNCWKQFNDSYMYVKYGKGKLMEKSENPTKLFVEDIQHYPGNLDVSLVKIKIQQISSRRRIFPCFLSSKGVKEAALKSVHGILTSQSYKKRKMNVKLNSYILQVSKSCEEDQICLKGNSKFNHKKKQSESDALPFFVKVGRSKWALAGIITKPLDGSKIAINSVSVVTDWAKSVIL